MEFAKIHRSRIYEEIAEQLKAQIVAGALKPGDKLPSAKELTERFQVGRSTVREALSALQAMGMIETRQGEGSFVKALTPAGGLERALGLMKLGRETTLELLEARKALETANASIAAEKRTEEDLNRLEAYVSEMERHLGEEAIGERLDLSFHQAIAEATHNSILVNLLHTISAQMETAIRDTRRLQMYGSKPVSERLWIEHRNIIAAIRDGNPELARRQMLAHLLHVEQIVTRYLADSTS